MYYTIRPKKGCTRYKRNAFYTAARWRMFYDTKQTPRSVVRGGVMIPARLLPEVLTAVYKAMSLKENCND